MSLCVLLGNDGVDEQKTLFRRLTWIRDVVVTGPVEQVDERLFAVLRETVGGRLLVAAAVQVDDLPKIDETLP